MQMVVHFLCSDTNHSLNLAFKLLTTIATSEDKQKLNAMGIQLAELEAGLVRKKFILITKNIHFTTSYCALMRLKQLRLVPNTAWSLNPSRPRGITSI